MGDFDAIRRFADEATVEPEACARARAHALELGADPISAPVGAQCAVIAAAANALNIVEIGTGGGVSGLWLLHGSPRATLTTIDNEPEHLAAARRAFADAKIPPARARRASSSPSRDIPKRWSSRTRSSRSVQGMKGRTATPRSSRCRPVWMS